MGDIVKYTTNGQEIILSPQIVKRYLVSGDADRVTDQEVMMFIKLCEARKLNPFLREAYCIKYGNAPASLVVGKDAFTTRASTDERCGGWEAGVVVLKQDGQMETRAGALVAPKEKLIGGWAKAYRKDWDGYVEITVSLDEYIGRKKDGTPNTQWRTMPATMIRKVALVQALREAFPDTLGGMYSTEEMKVDETTLPQEQVEIVVEDIKDTAPSTPSETLTKKTTPNWEEEYINNATDAGLHYEEIRLIAEHTAERQWKEISPATFELLAKRFNGSKEHAEEAAAKARIWLSSLVQEQEHENDGEVLEQQDEDEIS